MGNNYWLPGVKNEEEGTERGADGTKKEMAVATEQSCILTVLGQFWTLMSGMVTHGCTCAKAAQSCRHVLYQPQIPGFDSAPEVTQDVTTGGTG